MKNQKQVIKKIESVLKTCCNTEHTDVAEKMLDNFKSIFLNTRKGRREYNEEYNQLKEKLEIVKKQINAELVY